MRAAFYQGNETIAVGECIPVAPGPGDVRIRVAYCGICGTDLHVYHGKMDKRVQIPQIIGHEMSGEIEELGEGVSGLRIGDRVVVRPLQPCGSCPACQRELSHICYNLKFLGLDTPGAFQGSWTVPAHAVHRLPEAVSLEQGALVEPLAVACHDVRMAELREGESAVVIGGGPIGLLIALVARSVGADVLVSEIHPFRRKLAEELGIETVDPQATDLERFVLDRTAKAGADAVFEVSGTQAGVEAMTKLARARGRVVMVAIHSQLAQVDLFRFFWRELRLIGARVYEPQDYERAIAVAASGEIPLQRLVSATYSLDELRRAFQEMESGAEVVKILIRCSE
ncbi:alcohol dehydrogenase catalytic domain-containing protein [Candidatus Sumerlaeota bacterium]|nr:alcohol dehydrogenase catalytic domain-containing protein [Candidatus Sumerlaeota bacterium]